MHKAYIALGSNLHEPVKQLQDAFAAINTLYATHIIKQSSLYQTAPEGYLDQPDFINAVVLVETKLPAPDLMQALLAIEQTFGRERPFANAPRTLDCDMLLYDDVSMQTDLLTLPHPRMHLRGFVLLPLAEIAPDLSLPDYGSVVKLSAQYRHENIKKLGV